MASPEFDASRKGSDGLVCAMSTAWTTKLEIEKRAHSFTVKPGGGIDFLLHALDFCSKGIFALDCAIVIVSEEGCEMMEFSPASNFIARKFLSPGFPLQIVSLMINDNRRSTAPRSNGRCFRDSITRHFSLRQVGQAQCPRVGCSRCIKVLQKHALDCVGNYR